MEMKTFLLTATYLVGIGELILAIFFWMTHSKSEIRKVMALLALSTGLWVIFSGLLAYSTEASLLINSFVYVFGIFLLTSLVHLSIVFPLPLVHLDRLHRTLMYLPATLFSIIALTTRTIELDYVASVTNVGSVVAGPLLPFYNVLLLCLYLLAVGLLIKQSKRNDAINGRNVFLVLLSVIIGGLPAVFIDLIWPIFFPNFVPNFLYGVLSSVIWFATTTYIVIKK